MQSKPVHCTTADTFELHVEHIVDYFFLLGHALDLSINKHSCEMGGVNGD